MKTDTDPDLIDEASEREAARLMRLLKTPRCVYCGENAPEMVCDDCDRNNTAKNEALTAQRAEQALEARIQALRDKVGGYADTVRELLPDTAASRATISHIIRGRYGLTIIGPGNTGKTRSAIWLGVRELEAGSWVEFRQCGELRQEIIAASRNAIMSSAARPLLKCDFLILDDFGNHEFTRTTEEFFLALVERRTSSGKRTVVTTQYTTAQLKALMTTPQMADAIIRRIGRQFAVVANTADNTILQP